MKFLYYSTSYYANHGGSIQAIEFYKQLNNVEGITEKYIFPVKSKNNGFIENKKNHFANFSEEFLCCRFCFFIDATGFILKN